MNISEIMQKMIDYSQGNFHDIDHFIKVWAYAKLIAERENIGEKDKNITEAAAIVHDIACPLCRKKYGNTNGKYQEAEGGKLCEEFLGNIGVDNDDIKRISYLVSHHHSFSDIDGIDYQILIEADYIVNAEESGYTAENIKNFTGKYFKTDTAKKLIRSLYGV